MAKEIQMPTVKERCTRAIIAGMLAMGIGASALSAMGADAAYAEPGSVTITQVANADATYNVYQAFTADVAASDVYTQDDTNGTYWLDTDSNSYVTTEPSNNDGHKYVKETKDMGSHVAWNADNKAAIQAFVLSATSVTGASQTYADWLTAKGYAADASAENAQNVAEYISEMVKASTTDEDAATTPVTKTGHSFANRLARALATNGTVTNTATSGTAYTNDEGYYLFVSTTATVDGSGEFDEGGTAPMWIALGGQYTAINAKEAGVSSTFTVKEDKTSTWGKAADSNKGQELQFQRNLTVPQNIQAYPSFHVLDTITLPSGMSLANDNTSSVRVMVDGQDVTSQATIAYASDVLTVDIADLMTLTGLSGTVNKTSIITIDYVAHLDADAVLGQAGNQTTAVYTYTKDPVSLADGNATTQSVENYAYKGIVVKLDKANQMALDGAKFTIQVADYATIADSYQALTLNTGDAVPTGSYISTGEGVYSGTSDTTAQEGVTYYKWVPGSAALANANTGKYVQADGSLGDTAYEFESGAGENEQGYFNFPTIDEGVYVLHETVAPTGYQLEDADITLTVTSALNQTTGALDDLTATVSGGEAVSVTGDVPTALISVDKATGIINIRAVDDREFELADTGLSGNMWLYLIAGALAGAGVVGVVTYRKREGEQD